MLYSCFDDARGLYRVFQDRRTKAVNADLDVPSLGRMAGKVGVPSLEAGRSLPSGAKFVGDSWHARGQVVTCSKRSGLGELASEDTVKAGALIALGALAAFIVLRGVKI
jgi:hypothetical protein